MDTCGISECTIVGPHYHDAACIDMHDYSQPPTLHPGDGHTCGECAWQNKQVDPRNGANWHTSKKCMVYDDEPACPAFVPQSRKEES
jgi:hypothetical protein